MKSLFLYACFAAGAGAASLAGNVGYVRLKAASAIVADRHARDAEPPGRLARIAETVGVAATRPVARLAPAVIVPAAPVTEGVGSYDPRDLEELRREGIDLAAVHEIRELMRGALADPDPARRLALAADLKRRFGLDADPALYGRIERLGDGTFKPSFTTRGLRLIGETTQRVSRLYDKLLEL